MVDLLFEDADLAALYDLFSPNGPRGDFPFYLPHVLAAPSVLDIGCGTGSLLHAARAAGHTGRLCGLDPAEGMLAQARRRTDIEWVHGDLSTVRFEHEFDLAVMTGHAFQVFGTDAELRTALTAIREALTEDGRFAFETRNPRARGWERWVPANAVEVTTPGGAVVRMAHQVHTPVTGDLVTFTTTFSSPSWARPRTSESTLRFLDTDALAGFLAEAGLTVDEQYGDWAGGPVTDTSPEIIVFARPSR